MNKQENEHGMVDSFEEVVELGKEMEQISNENDEEKYDQTHDEVVRSDRDTDK